MAKISWSAALAAYLRDETVSYQIVADRFGVSKQAVVARAKKEGWQELRAETRSKVDQKLTEIAAEDITEVRKKHAYYGKKLREIGTEAFESGRVSINSARDALQCIKEGVEIEKYALGMGEKMKNLDKPRIIMPYLNIKEALLKVYGPKAIQSTPIQQSQS